MIALLAAAIIAVTPATLPAALASYAANDTIQLQAAPTPYPWLYLRGKTALTKPVTIAGLPGAVAAGIRCDACTNVTVTGLAFDGGGKIDAGAQFVAGNHITVSLNTFTGFVRAGVEIGANTDDSRITGNTISRSGSDGIDVAASHRVQVDHNTCMDASPTPGAHPDCVQLWSIAGIVPTSDVAITDNNAVGAMQGYSLFNHVINGVDQGGFDRIAITGNFAALSYPDGISVYACRGCIVGGTGTLANTIRTLSGATYQAHLYADPVSAPGVAANNVGPK